jgi:enoyl-CoA hydratase/carnithine racemase
MNDDAIRLEQKGQVFWLILNRPEVHNALNGAMITRLNQWLDVMERDRDCRVVVLIGAGDRAFCAGADLKERATFSPEEVVAFVAKLRRTFLRLFHFPKPTMACLNGLALGGGLELAMTCDLRVAQENARIGLTETSLGIIPGAGGTQFLSRVVGQGVAKELIFTAQPISVVLGNAMGIVQHVYTQESLIKKTQMLAERIALNAPIALSMAKKAIQEGFDLPIDEALEVEAQCYDQVIPTRDRLEGLAAFKEKRKPIFCGE